MGEARSGRSGRGPRAILLSGLLPPLLALAVWSPVLTHGLLWDDPVILERQLPGLTVAKIFAPPPGLYQWTYHYYRPLVLLSLLLDRALYGTEPFGYHLTVLLLHAAAAGSVFALARRITSRPGAVLAASLFAVYPASAECVGWIAGRNDIMAGLFSALAAATFLAAAGFRAVDAGTGSAGAPAGAGGTVGASAKSGRRGRAARRGPKEEPAAPARDGEDPGAPSWTPFGAAAIFFLGALLSKETAIGLAPVLAVAAWAAGLRGRRLLAAGISAAAPILVAMAMRRFLDPHAAGESFSAGPLTPAQSVVWTAAFFPAHLLAPFLGPIYRVAPPMSLWIALASAAIVAAAIVLVARLGTRRRPDLVLASAWILSAIATVSAAAAWSATRTPVADRYFYLPAIGWCVFLGALCAGPPGAVRADAPGPGAGSAGAGSAGTGGAKTRRPVGPIVGWVLVAVFAAASLIRRPAYANDRSFWTAATASEPESGAALMNLGNVLAQGGDLDGAQRAYRRALATPLAGADLALVLTDLGSVLYQTGRMPEAEENLRRAAATDATSATANFNLGAFLYQKGMERLRHGDIPGSRPPIAEARPYLEKAVAQDGTHVRALTLLGHCYRSEGRLREAREAYERAVRLDGRDGYIGREAAAALDQMDPRP